MIASPCSASRVYSAPNSSSKICLFLEGGSVCVTGVCACVTERERERVCVCVCVCVGSFQLLAAGLVLLHTDSHQLLSWSFSSSPQSSSSVHVGSDLALWTTGSKWHGSTASRSVPRSDTERMAKIARIAVSAAHDCLLLTLGTYYATLTGSFADVTYDRTHFTSQADEARTHQFSTEFDLDFAENTATNNQALKYKTLGFLSDHTLIHINIIFNIANFSAKLPDIPSRLASYQGPSAWVLRG